MIPRRSPTSRLEKRIAMLCRVVIGNEDERGGPVREDGKVRAARTQKTIYTPFGSAFSAALGERIVLAGRQ